MDYICQVNSAGRGAIACVGAVIADNPYIKATNRGAFIPVKCIM